MADSQSNARLRADAGAPTSGVIHVRTRLTADFTVISNALAQRRGSAVTVGVAVYVLSLPDGTPVSITALCEHFDEGEILISRALRELEAAGYLERRRERTPAGKIRTRTYFYDVPGGDPGLNPDPDPDPDPNPDPDGSSGPPKPRRPRKKPAEAAVTPSPVDGTVTAPAPARTEAAAPIPLDTAEAHADAAADPRAIAVLMRPAARGLPPRPVRAGSRPPRPGRHPVARGRPPARPDHRPPHRASPGPLPGPPGRHPRLPAQGDAPSPARTGRRRGPRRTRSTSSGHEDAELRRLRPGLPLGGTQSMPGLPIR